MVRIALSGDQFLKCQMNVNTDINGIDGILRICSMGTSAVNRDFKAIHGKHHGILVIIHDQTHGQLSRSHMKSQSRIYFRILQNTCLDHILTAFKGLLRRLEHKFHRTLQQVFLLFQHFCRRQQHGRMEIMTAGMILCACGARKVFSALLRHGKRIHICPKKQHLAAMPQCRGDTVTTFFRFQTIFCQFLHNICLGFRHIQPDLRICMKISSVFNGFLIQFHCTFIKIHCHTSLTLLMKLFFSSSLSKTALHCRYSSLLQHIIAL